MTMTTTLRAANLTCPSCVWKIAATLKAIEGVRDATVHFTTGRIVVAHDPSVSRETLIQTMRAAGYDATLARFP
jgi:copper chaperone